MAAHRRQFLIGPRPMLVDDAWRVVELTPDASVLLSHCPELPVVVAGSGKDRRVLIGDALNADLDAEQPHEQLHGIGSSHELLRATRSWCGRWLLVLGRDVHMDACGMLGCVYRTEAGSGSTSAGATTWASSSVALLASAGIAGDPGTRAPRLAWEAGFDYYPAPATAYANIHRLLASQVLTLGPGGDGPRLRPRELPSRATREGRDDDARLDHIERLLIGGARATGRRFDTVWLPLTAGQDSRLLLATAHAAGLPAVTTYTQTYAWPRMSRADRTIPAQLAELVGYEHRLLEPVEGVADRSAEFDLASGHEVDDIDRLFWLRGQWDQVPAGAAVLRGSVFEVASTTYHKGGLPNHRVLGRLDAAPGAAGMAAAIRCAWALDVTHAGSAPHRTGLERWEEWVLAHPQPAIDWRDRVYLEQRMGAWAAAVEQRLDITGTHRAYLANCHDLLSTALALPHELLYGGAWGERMIQRLAPELLTLPINPPDGTTQRVAKRIRQEWRNVAAAGNRSGYLGQRVQTVAARLRADRMTGSGAVGDDVVEANDVVAALDREQLRE